ncbi:hypothetical protein T069G_03276 [Trichoderma breve]|uniref:Peptidase metallopeptidase domain-containing protein n=1 Tax=Trichoderma breve TaxID=2034170 RepID=A0A9W9BH19_9HYPO|nr:hypothetical protein T069G_03276 [Trichoderma breve]KAJ4862322.1 hypothetical protein T069G_03276 [Trichoderma breve]
MESRIMEQMSGGMRDDSEPWALGYRHQNTSGNNFGTDYNYNLEDLDETSRSSSAEGKSVSARTTDRSDTITVATSITTDLDVDDRNTDTSNNSANKTAVAHILPLPSFLLDGPTDGSATRYDQVLMIDDEERDRAENASSGVTTTGATNTAAAHTTHECLTQTHGCAEVRVGFGFRGEIPRWSRGSELGYAIHDETFPSDLSAKIGPAMEKAVDLWQNHGVSFKQVGRNDPATFAVVYENGPPKAYARSFFPNESRRTLSVFQRTRRAPDSLPGLLAHELGHIQGLRHEFAHTDEEEMQFPSVLVGSENTKSIMNYFARPEEYQVQQSDLKELRSFYEYDKAEYKGLLIRDIDPVVGLFSEEDERMNPIVSFVTALR